VCVLSLVRLVSTQNTEHKTLNKKKSKQPTKQALVPCIYLPSRALKKKNEKSKKIKKTQRKQKEKKKEIRSRAKNKPRKNKTKAILLYF
jgi:hypothetical protein